VLVAASIRLRERGRFPGPRGWWPLVFVGTALMFWSPTVVGHGRRCSSGFVGGFAFFRQPSLYETTVISDRCRGLPSRGSESIFFALGCVLMWRWRR
jgi:hypothetical protein